MSITTISKDVKNDSIGPLGFPYKCWSLKLEKRCMKSMGVWKAFKKQRGCSSDSLHEAFFWHFSEEGQEFWHSVADRINAFMSLVDAVEKINPEVAQWMQKGMFKDDTAPFVCGNLMKVFIFSSAPFKSHKIYDLCKNLPPEYK